MPTKPSTYNLICITYNSNLANNYFMSYNFMTHKTSRIAQLFQNTKNKFST